MALAAFYLCELLVANQRLWVQPTRPAGVKRIPQRRFVLAARSSWWLIVLVHPVGLGPRMGAGAPPFPLAPHLLLNAVHLAPRQPLVVPRDADPGGKSAVCLVGLSVLLFGKVESLPKIKQSSQEWRGRLGFNPRHGS